MKRYQFPMPRAVLGFAAVALTALSVGVWIVAPMALNSGPAEAPAVAIAPTPEAQAVADGAIRLERMEVVAQREPTLLTTLVHYVQPLLAKHKQPS